jgi:hypothetical protein
MNDIEKQSFRQKLDAVYSWPSNYTFKFVCQAAKREQLQAVIPIGTIQEKQSRSGRYVSLTITARMNSSSEVIQAYERVGQLPDVIAL